MQRQGAQEEDRRAEEQQKQDSVVRKAEGILGRRQEHQAGTRVETEKASVQEGEE